MMNDALGDYVVHGLRNAARILQNRHRASVRSRMQLSPELAPHLAGPGPYLDVVALFDYEATMQSWTITIEGLAGREKIAAGEGEFELRAVLTPVSECKSS